MSANKTQISLQPNQQLLVDEFKELREKLYKLRIFIASEMFIVLDTMFNQTKLIEQENVMTRYAEILKSRLENSIFDLNLRKYNGYIPKEMSEELTDGIAELLEDKTIVNAMSEAFGIKLNMFDLILKFSEFLDKNKPEVVRPCRVHDTTNVRLTSEYYHLETLAFAICSNFNRNEKSKPLSYECSGSYIPLAYNIVSYHDKLENNIPHYIHSSAKIFILEKYEEKFGILGNKFPPMVTKFILKDIDFIEDEKERNATMIALAILTTHPAGYDIKELIEYVKTEKSVNLEHNMILEHALCMIKDFVDEQLDNANFLNLAG